MVGALLLLIGALFVVLAPMIVTALTHASNNLQMPEVLVVEVLVRVVGLITPPLGAALVAAGLVLGGRSTRGAVEE